MNVVVGKHECPTRASELNGVGVCCCKIYNKKGAQSLKPKILVHDAKHIECGQRNI